MPNVRRGGKVEIAFTMAPFNVSTATQTFHYRAVNFGGAVFPLHVPRASEFGVRVAGTALNEQV